MYDCKCKICSKKFNSIRGLSIHIKKSHDIDIIDYYDKYYKNISEDICIVCGAKTKFVSLSMGYKKVCSISCGQLNPETRAKIEKTNIEKYGFSTPLITKESLNKSHCCEAMNKKKETMIAKYGVASMLCKKETQDKIKDECIKKYGVDNPAKSNIVKEKTKQYFIDKYGFSSPFKIPEVREKIRLTCLAKYGVANPFESSDLMKNAYSYEARLKANRTRMKNGNTSSLENYLENALIANNINYKPQYNLDNRYLYHCDFYLPDTDTFVEINGFWTHQDHYFNNTDKDDLIILNNLINKASVSTMYPTAIRVWTISDVKKRQSAKENNLNYIVLWNLIDIEDWITTKFIIRHDY